MRKFLLFSFALLFGVFAMAQKFGQIPASLKSQSATMAPAVYDMPMNLSYDVNPYVRADVKAISEEMIGTTVYDLQSNQSVQNRVYLHPDGKIGGTWTFGVTSPSFADRGTGYNFYDNVAWGADPTARIEAARCGWPSYASLGTDGEVAITHDGSNGLLIYTRSPKGTGSWTLTNTLVGPTAVGSSTTALLWPRAITVGNTIHVIACTDQAVSPAVYYYQGLALALLYYKSTDGGATWSAPQILPGMDSASVVTAVNAGFGGDSYSWAKPNGDTIAFVVGDSWGDLFAMKSFDAGATWTKVMVYDFPNVTTAPTPIIASNDGSLACGVDHNGDVHVLFGKMRVSDDILGDANTSYYPYTDGLIYWNENMQAFDSALLNNDSIMFLNGQYIAGMLDYDSTGVIEFPTVGSGEFPFGNYYLSLTSMPQMLIEGDNIYVTYSSCREGKTNPGANPNEQLYRDLYVMKSMDLGQTWCNVPTDLVDNSTHLFDECVFGSLSYSSNDNLHVVFQADEEPGLAVRGDADAYTTNYIYYITIPKAEICQPIGVVENSASTEVSLYPNPASGSTSVALTLENGMEVSINVVNIIGENVFAKNYGSLNAGQHNLTINTSNFDSGLYFVSIQAGDSKITRKLIVE